MLKRRQFLGLAAAAGLAGSGLGGAREPELKRVPVIDITDLYHPPQDPGDNLDLIAAYGLPEVDLKAVILDVTDRFRRPVSGPEGEPYRDTGGPRDPGFIPVWQLNALFGRNVPCAVGPYAAMRSPEDPMRDTPAFQQQGVELILKTLRESEAPVHILSFGSARPLAVAYNRDPELLRRKVACGTSRRVGPGRLSGVERYARRGSLRARAPLRPEPGHLPLRRPTRAHSTSGSTTRSGSCPTCGSSASYPPVCDAMPSSPWAGPSGWTSSWPSSSTRRTTWRSKCIDARTTSGKPRSGPRFRAGYSSAGRTARTDYFRPSRWLRRTTAYPAVWSRAR